MYVGRGSGSLPVFPASLPFGCSVHIPTRGTLPELAEVVALGRGRAVRAETECLTLGQAADAYRRLRRGEVRAGPWLRRALVRHLMWHQSLALQIGKTCL